MPPNFPLRRHLEGNNLVFDPVRQAQFETLQVVVGLKVQPALGENGGAERF
jgi:hypothetical protein